MIYLIEPDQHTLQYFEIDIVILHSAGKNEKHVFVKYCKNVSCADDP